MYPGGYGKRVAALHLDHVDPWHSWAGSLEIVLSLKFDPSLFRVYPRLQRRQACASLRTSVLRTLLANNP